MATRALADLAFLRTFGFRPPTPDDPELAFEAASPTATSPWRAPPSPSRSTCSLATATGSPAPRSPCSTTTAARPPTPAPPSDGHGVLTARHTGGYMLVATYRFREDYGLSVSAHEREPAALVVEIADEADLRQDVELPPAGRGRAAPHRSRPSASCSRSTAEGASSSGSSSVPFRYTSPPEPIQRGEATTGSGLIERGGYVATTGIACHRAGSRQDPTSTGPRWADQQHDPAA